MNDIYRIPAHTNTLVPGEDWNPMLRELEAMSGDRHTALKRGAEYVLYVAFFEDTDMDLPTISDNFAEAVHPPLSDPEQEVFWEAFTGVSKTRHAVEAIISRRENIIARCEEFA